MKSLSDQHLKLSAPLDALRLAHLSAALASPTNTGASERHIFEKAHTVFASSEILKLLAHHVAALATALNSGATGLSSRPVREH